MTTNAHRAIDRLLRHASDVTRRRKRGIEMATSPKEKKRLTERLAVFTAQITKELDNLDARIASQKVHMATVQNRAEKKDRKYHERKYGNSKRRW